MGLVIVLPAIVKVMFATGRLVWNLRFTPDEKIDSGKTTDHDRSLELTNITYTHSLRYPSSYLRHWHNQISGPSGQNCLTPSALLAKTTRFDEDDNSALKKNARFYGKGDVGATIIVADSLFRLPIRRASAPSPSTQSLTSMNATLHIVLAESQMRQQICLHGPSRPIKPTDKNSNMAVGHPPEDTDSWSSKWH